MKIKDVESLLRMLPAWKAIFIAGPHGIGKSDIVRDFAKEIGFKLFDIRLSQFEVGDIAGLPDKSGDVTKFIPPAWLKEASKGKSIIFFDELPRASKDVLQVVFQIVLDRKYTANGISLADDVHVICAGNLGMQYQYEELDPALKDRFFFIDLDPENKEWIDWARGHGINKYVISYIEDMPAALDPPDNQEPLLKYPSRRSWTHFSEILNTIKEKPNERLLSNLGEGFLGASHGVAFAKFFLEKFKKCTPEEILEGKGTADYDDFDCINILINEINEFVNKENFKWNWKKMFHFGDFCVNVSKNVKNAAESLALIQNLATQDIVKGDKTINNNLLTSLSTFIDINNDDDDETTFKEKPANKKEEEFKTKCEELKKDVYDIFYEIMTKQLDLKDTK